MSASIDQSATRPFRARISTLFDNPRVKGTLAVLSWLPVALFVTDNVVGIIRVDGRSMQPTFNPDASTLQRDIVLVNRLPSWWRLKGGGLVTAPWKRGDVVTLWSPTNPNLLLTKRLIALPGDVVRTLPPYPDKLVRIPEGSCWVEGDEGFHTRDSNTFGPVPLGLLTSRASLIIYPFRRFGPVPPTYGKEDRVRSAFYGKGYVFG